MVRRKTRIAILIVFLLVLCVMAAGAYVIWSPSHEADFEKIAEGMTYSQVVKMLGVEPGDHRTAGTTYVVIVDPITNQYVDKEGQRRTAYRWYFDEGSTLIIFDENNTVHMKIWFVNQAPPRGILDRLRQFIGID